uniref:LRAT domain-containing protein n=1 Tax=Poecilia reticulata TaxID=8081 RepID=A0A3P9N5H0_POERE
PQFDNGDEPKPGDLIEIFRNVYEHWAVYVGDGYVVHLLGPDGNFSSFSTINLPMGKNNILKQKLLEVVSSDEWHINNILDQEKQPRPAHIIVDQANKLVSTTRSYNVVDYNCEHFATELRYGDAESQQVRLMECGCVDGLCSVIMTFVPVDAVIILWDQIRRDSEENNKILHHNYTTE